LGKHFGTGILLATGYVHMLGAAEHHFEHPCLKAWLPSFSRWGDLIVMLTGLAMHTLEFGMGEWARSLRVCEENEDAAETLLESVPGAYLESLGDLTTPLISHPSSSYEAIPVVTTSAVAVALLEISVATHSILIGITLGLIPPNAPSFFAIWMALLFHQFFEGLALGSRIAIVSPTQRRAFTLAAAFAITAPVGACVGIAFRGSGEGRSPEGLLVQAVLDAVAAGMLIYIAYVDLMAGEILNDVDFHQLCWQKKSAAFLALWSGVATMTILGVWV